MFITSFLCAQTTIDHYLNRQKWIVSFTLGGDLLFFNNKPSLLLKSDKHGNLNAMSEGLGQIEILYTYERLAIMSGVGIISQGYHMSNDTWFIDLFSRPTSTAAFYKLHYKHTYYSIPVGAGIVISPKSATRRVTILYCQLVNGFRQTTKTEVEYYSGTSQAQVVATESFLQTRPLKKHSSRVAIGIGYKWNIKGSGIGLSLNMRMVKMLTSADSEFVGRPFGFGFHIGILHQLD